MSLKLPTFVRLRPYFGVAFRSSFFVDENLNQIWFKSLNRKINYTVNSTYKIEYGLYINMIFIKYIYCIYTVD